MKWFNGYGIRLVLVGFMAATIIIGGGIANAATINQAPIADAGLCRYVAQHDVYYNSDEQAVIDGAVLG
jgi:hypothetical protein